MELPNDLIIELVRQSPTGREEQAAWLAEQITKCSEIRAVRMRIEGETKQELETHAKRMDSLGREELANQARCDHPAEHPGGRYCLICGKDLRCLNDASSRS